MNKIILILLLMASSVSAVVCPITTWNVNDINTRMPIANATIRFYLDNGTLYNTTYTDALGFFQGKVINGTAYFTKTGYYPVNTSATSVCNNYVIMTPISSDGIVRFRLTDLSTGDRNYCIFYKENMRLAECYKHNDTATVIVNREYVIKPEIRKEDALMSLKSMDKIGGFYTGALWPILVIIVVSIILIIVIKSAFKK